jgi:hypothetical protein
MINVQTEASKVETEGVWKQYEENAGVKFKIARAGNTKYLKAVDFAEAPYKKKIRQDKLGTEKQIEIQCRAMAKGILTDWEGLESSGAPLEYNEDNAYLVLRHNPDVREFIHLQATQQENFFKTEVDESAKKSKST